MVTSNMLKDLTIELHTLALDLLYTGYGTASAQLIFAALQRGFITPEQYATLYEAVTKTVQESHKRKP